MVEKHTLKTCWRHHPEWAGADQDCLQLGSLGHRAHAGGVRQGESPAKSSAAAGILFVFKAKYRAVLSNYPNHEEKEVILRSAGFLTSGVSGAPISGLPGSP